MTKMREWDIYEAAILLEAYLKVHDGKLTKQKAIEEVSGTLRKMATNQGHIIDDTYRNDNGISIQFYHIEATYLGIEKGKASARVFIQIVELFKNNNTQYCDVLAQAYAMLEPKKTLADVFKDWLTNNYPKLSCDSILCDLQTAEEYCTKKLILRTPLLETTDPAIIKRVFLTVESDRIFRFTYKNRRNDIHKATSLYYKFVKSGNAVQTQNVLTEGQNPKAASPVAAGEVLTEPVETTTANNTGSSENDHAELNPVGDTVLEYLKSHNIEYIDLRDKQGCLWIIGGASIDHILNPLRAAGMVLVYKREGGTATGGREAYWTKDRSPSYAIEKKPESLSAQEPPKQSSATDQRLQRKYPNEYKLIREKLFELTQQKKDGITISDFQDALKLQISYFVSHDILSNAPWSERCGNSRYGVPIFRYNGEYSEENETTDVPAITETPVTSTNNIKDSLLKTIEYLATRYSVRLAYDHFENPTTRSNDILYKARNDHKDVMWVYYIQSKTTHYVSVETEPEYVESIDHALTGFTKIQDRNAHPCRKMFFEDYEAIKASLVEICDSIDRYFAGARINVTPNPDPEPVQKEKVALDWEKSVDLAYTTPCGFSYFNEYYPASTWSELYAKVIAKLHEDYPNILMPNMCLAERDNGHIELGDAESVSSMRRAKQLPGTMIFIESNISATGIANRIRHVLDLCSVDYKSIHAFYNEKTSAEDDFPSTHPEPVNTEPQGLDKRYPEYYDKIGDMLYDLTSNGGKAVTASEIQKAFKGTIPYSAIGDILDHATWSVSVGVGAYGAKTFRHKDSHAGCKTDKPTKQPIPVKPAITRPSGNSDEKRIKKAEAIVLKADLEGVTVDELASKMQTSVSDAKSVVQSSINIVSICDKLIHKEAFMDWDDGADKLEAVLDKLMTRNNGYVSDSQLYDFARIEMQMFLNDNDMDDKRKVFDMAEHLFSKEGYHGKHYTFWMKTHISPVQDTITSKLDIMRKYARDEDGFFREYDLENYLKGLGIKTANLRQQMRVYDEPIFLFYEPGVFITTESMGVNESWLNRTAQAFSKLFADVGDHIVLRDIQPWWYNIVYRGVSVSVANIADHECVVIAYVYSTGVILHALMVFIVYLGDDLAHGLAAGHILRCKHTEG